MVKLSYNLKSLFTPICKKVVTTPSRKQSVVTFQTAQIFILVVRTFVQIFNQKLGLSKKFLIFKSKIIKAKATCLPNILFRD